MLNVIQDPKDRLKVLQQGKAGLKKKGTMYVSVYEGTKPNSQLGFGTSTSNGWQNNARTNAYLDEVKKVFGSDNVNYDTKRKLIVARKFNFFLSDIKEFNVH